MIHQYILNGFYMVIDAASGAVHSVERGGLCRAAGAKSQRQRGQDEQQKQYLLHGSFFLFNGIYEQYICYNG